ncbi:MAG TPA: hypothetical protein VK171_08550 [Fimbriimonas sp.]|nr:hypothetical protein [Fimbriimonas sp.]
MTGNQLINAYSEIVLNDLYPVAAFDDSGTVSSTVLHYLNVAARRICRLLRVRAKSSFVYYEGVQEYVLSALPTPLFEVSRVVVNATDIRRATLEDNFGWLVLGDHLVFNETFADESSVVAYGFRYPVEIEASDAEVTTLPADLHIPLVQLAVVEGCSANEDDQEQMLRLRNMESAALVRVDRFRHKEAMNSVPLAMFDGAR